MSEQAEILQRAQSSGTGGPVAPHVLVIDDSPDIPRLVKALLRADGVVVHSADDGERGLIAAAELAPDLILLDVDMPSPDGFEVCRRLKADLKLREIPVIFCTGLSAPEQRLHGLELGAIDYVIKPFDRAELRARVRSALKTRQLINLLAQDVSRRKQAQELERDRAQVLEMVAVGRPFDDVLAHLTAMLERHYPAGLACALALSEGRMHVVGPSLPGDLYISLREHGLKLAARVCSDASSTGQTFFTADISSDPNWQPLRDVAMAHRRSICCSRLIQSATHGVIGMISIYLRTGEQPPELLNDLLDVTATLISIATEHRYLSERLTYQASHDALTGLPNRLFFEDRLQKAIAEGERTGKSVGLLFFDLDRFKLVNDTLGHQSGDELLRQLAGRMLSAMRPGDTLARMGGDEFGMILEAPATREDAIETARRVQQAVDPRFTIGNHEIVTSLSIGIALYPEHAGDSQSLQSRADIAMYRMKLAGSNGYQFYAQGMDKSAAQRIDLEYRLRAALERNEFSMHYQPQVDQVGKLVGLEALLRWVHPELGNVAPAAFIPVAEECGLIVLIGAWVLREVCRQGKAWRDAGLDPLMLAVNVSAIQFTQADFVERAIKTLEETGFDPRWLELEVTESSVMGDINDAAAKLRQLTERQVKIAVDDFGTGHSSLAYLDALPLQSLKIDRSFVRGLDAHAIATPARTTIVRAITSLGHNLGLSVVAEGVETVEQYQFLKDICVDTLQGYLFGRPQPAAQIEELFLQASSRQRTLISAVKAA